MFVFSRHCARFKHDSMHSQVCNKKYKLYRAENLCCPTVGHFMPNFLKICLRESQQSYIWYHLRYSFIQQQSSLYYPLFFMQQSCYAPCKINPGPGNKICVYPQTLLIWLWFVCWDLQSIYNLNVSLAVAYVWQVPRPVSYRFVGDLSSYGRVIGDWVR